VNLPAFLRQPPPAPPLTDATEISRRYRYWRVRVMYAMTTGYALYYFTRKNISMAAKPIADEFGFTNTQWGVVLSAATIVYAFSKFLSGLIGDRANPRWLMAGGLLLSALTNVVFGWAAGLGAFIALWAINNLFQGMGSPPCFRLLTQWFSPREIGLAWGVWNASHQIGGAVIAVWAGWLVTHHGWRSAFWAPAAVCALGAFWLFNRLTDSPESHGLPPVEVYKDGAAPAPKTPLTAPFWSVFREHILTNPWVWIVSFANFFVYIVRIGVLDWAPKFLVEAKGYTLKDAGFALSAFELAGIFGALVAGWLSDRMGGRRGPVSVFFMLLLIASVGVLFFVPPGQRLLMAGVFTAIGVFVYGPQMLVAVAAADFASKQASAGAVGLTGLLGYFGATVCGVGTGVFVDRFGWNGALWFYAVSAVLGMLLLATTWTKSAANTRRSSS